LVYNNGGTVTISTGHQLLFNRVLNNQEDPTKNKIIFAIDLSPETLVFTGKISGI
jgi:hypothetical protein